MGSLKVDPKSLKVKRDSEGNLFVGFIEKKRLLHTSLLRTTNCSLETSRLPFIGDQIDVFVFELN